jgi:hypothetical protein
MALFPDRAIVLPFTVAEAESNSQNPWLLSMGV